MAIFDKELIDNTSDRANTDITLNPALGSPATREINPDLGGFEVFGASPSFSGGMTIEQMSNLTNYRQSPSFSSPFQMVPRSELLENQRYSLYERNKNLENINGLQQGWASQLANGVVKMGATALGTFAQSFATIPNTVSAIKSGKMADLSGAPDGYEASIDGWLKNVENYFPNYFTTKEKDHPYLAMLPFAPGSANFWGDKIIKNLGFTVGAIGGALVQDAAVGVITGGIGEIPLVASQIGKASLWLNKLFTGTNKVDDVINLAKGLGKTEQQLANIAKIGQLAETARLTNGFRYGLSLYGSARTEAAIEARDSYAQIKNELLRDYKLNNVGEDPTGEDAAQIERLATDAMNTRFGVNMALLTVSNAVQFDNLFKSFITGSKGVTGSLTRNIEEAGKIGLKEGSLDVFERKIPTTFGAKVWESVKPKLSNVFAEGVYEEGGQYATEKGVHDYYTRKYKNLSNPEYAKNWNETNEIVKSTVNGLAEQFGSSEGIENMLVGAISALISGGVLGKVNSSRGEGKDERLQSAINMLNQYGLTGILDQKYSNTLNSVGIAKEMQEAAKSGNVFKYKNLKDDLFFAFVESRIPSGMHDVTIEQLKMLKDLSKEEFEKTFGMDFSTSNKNTVSEYVDALILKADQIKKTTDALNFTYKNPFSRVIDPKTPEEEEQNNNYRTFENWKTDLSYYSYIAPSVNDRLSSIEESASKINSLLSNDLLSKLTNRESLNELRKSYEEQANNLNKTITENTSYEDKKRIKAQVKALRTAAEKIAIQANNGVPDGATFNFLLNFELNNQDATKDKVVGIENNAQLFEYGFDVNRLNNLKDRAGKILDDLTSKAGFDKYFQQAKDMADQKVEEAPVQEEAPITPTETPKYEFTNKAGQKESIRLNSEYEVPSFKKASVKKIADDRWEVTAPDGALTYHTTKEKADEAANEINDDFGNLIKVKVVGQNPDGTVKIQDKNGDIYDIDVNKLSGYERIESEEEKLAKKKDQIEKQEKEIETKSGTVNTGDPTKETWEEEGMLKDAAWLFTSGMTESEDWSDPTQSSPHVKRSRQFLNKAKTFPNRNKLRAILVTPKQVKALGLEGIVQLSYKKDLTSDVNEIEGVNDVDNGFVAQVFVIQESDGLYFVDENGEKISKVGEQVDLNKVVFQTMPTTSLKNSRGVVRHRADQKEQAEQMSKAWALKRAELFNAPENSYTTHEFVISRGIAEQNETKDGVKEKNHVGAILINSDEKQAEKVIASQEGLIVIPTENKIPHNGRLLNVPKGRPVLQYGDTLEFLNNKKFSKSQAKTIFEVMRVMADEIAQQSREGKDIQINKAYREFLQNVLFWVKGTTTAGNQMYVDESNLYLGGKPYSLVDFSKNEEAIIEQLLNTYNNVNNKTLTESFSEPFVEYYFEDGEIKDREWKNYQSYLLSAKTPDGKARNINETPLATTIKQPSSGVPYTHKQKYAILVGMELPIAQVAKPAPAAQTPPPTTGARKIGDYTEGVENTIKLKDPLGDTAFTFTIDENNVVSVEMKESPVIDEIAKDPAKAKPFIEASKATGVFDATKETKQLVLDVVALSIASKLQPVLNKQLEAQAAPAAAPVVTPAPTAPVSDVEAKKADIEKAGINNLIVSGLVTSPTTIEKGKQYLLVTFTGYTGIASKFEIVTATGNKREESQISSGSGVSKNLVDTFINEKGQEITTGGLNKKIVEFPTIDLNNKKEVLTFLLNQAKSGKLLSAPKGSGLGRQEFNENETKIKLGFLNSDFTIGKTWIDYDDSNRSQNTKLATDFLVAKYDAELAALTQPIASVSDKKAIVAAGIREQGTQVSVEVIGDSGKEFLLVIDRNSKGRVELFSEKKDWGDGTFTYRPGEGEQASQEQKVKLYNKYVPESVRNLITEWQNSFTGSWAAPETEDGKRHRAIEKRLEKELAALEGAKPASVTIQYQKPKSVSVYLSTPNQDGSFNKSSEKTSFVEGASIWAFEPIGNNRFNVYIANDPSAQKMAFQFPEKTIAPLFSNITSDFSQEQVMNAKSLDVIIPAVVELQGDKYVLISEGEVDVDQIKKNTKPAAEQTKTDPNKFKGFDGPSGDFRAVAAGEKGGMTEEELELFKQWHAENVPNIPFEVLENIIKTHDGGKAWGVFENGVAKFVRGGLRGTEYHEVFEGIWKAFLTEDQRQELMVEFRAKKGQFLDRESGKKIDYAEATDKQVKERIADDFSEFRLGKLPARSLGEKIRNFFKAIMDFFKSFVSKPSLKDKLFKAIDTGKFKEFTVSETVKNEAAEYRAVEGLTEQQTHEFVQDMTARSAGILFNEADKGALFNPERITSREMFSKIEEMYSREKNAQGFSKRDLLSDKAWEQLQKKTKDQLRTLGISFSEDDKVDINNEEYDNRLYAPEPFSTDWKKSSPFAIKFTLATLLKTAATNQSGNLRMELPKVETTSVGYKLLDFSRAFATLLDKLSNTTSVTKAVDKLMNLADNNADYVRLFRRLGGKTTEQGQSFIPFNEFSSHDWRLFINFMQVFTKQKPNAIIQYKSGNEVFSRSADVFTAAKETERGWIENMKALAKEQDSIIRLDRETKSYKINSEVVRMMPVSQPQDAISFLREIGITISMDDYLRMTNKNKFLTSVAKIHSYLGTNEDVVSLTGATLGIGGPLAELSDLYVKATNPNQENTHFNVEGKRTQNYADNNAASVFENTFNESETLDELLEKMPQLKDMFSANSQVLKKGGQFFDEDGKRIKTIKVKYVEGTKIVDRDRGITSSKLNLGDRFVQEINQNLKGDYYILIPADSSTEWMMEMGNTISFSDVDSGRAWNKIYNVFKGYLMDDINLALDWKNRSKLNNVKPRAKELRFFKDILSDKDLKNINQLIEDGATQDEIKDYLTKNSDSINAAVKQYIEATVENTASILKENSKIITTEKGFKYSELDDTFALSRGVGIDKNNMSEKDVNSVLTFANVNYIINNIEYHKILFGDPFQFKITDKDGKVILDETKRIKSFLSPRRTTFDHLEFNNYLNREYNKASGIELQPGDPGYHTHKSYTNTVTFADNNIAGSLANIMPAYGKVNEADAMSWLMDGTYREIKVKNGQWSDEAEAWHQWQMAWTRQNLPGYTYTNAALEKQDKEMISKPAPKHTIEILKPIVSGTKYGKSTIDTVLDKFSQMPIYYSMVKGTNLEKLYLQMMKQGVGYAIVESGRKVGAEGLQKIYNPDGSFNDTVFNNNVQVPWGAYGIQVETTYEGEKQQTRGSQLTKLSSMDLFENGEASEEAKKEYARNKDILDKMHENAYKELLEKLGIEDIGTGFVLPGENHKFVSEVLVYEMLRRELSDNTKDTVQLDENDQFRIPFEASPSYVQIRNILYSMIDKAILSPKMNGGAHVQVPVTMFESATKGRSLAERTKDGWKKITKQEYEKLSDERKKNVVLTDDTLKFYTEKDPYCEIMLPHWFGEKLMKAGKFKSDEELLNYLNNTKEGKKILTGIGFRIPSDALNKVEVFRVKGFLPQYMGLQWLFLQKSLQKLDLTLILINSTCT
jgi:hypothetical protein